MKKFCMYCGSENHHNNEKCNQCNTIFGSITVETKKESQPELIKIKPPLGILSADLFEFEKSLNDPSAQINGNFGGSDLEFDFSSLAEDLEKQLNSSKNGAIKNLKTIKAEDFFRKE